VAMDRREQIVETVVESAPTQTVEERVVDQDGAVRRVVRSVGEAAPPLVATTVVTHPPTVRRTVSRFWRRSSVPAVAATTEYAVVGEYGGGEPSLGQLIRVAWFFVGLIEGLLALRFALALLGANPTNGFAALVYGISWPFVAPFRTLFGVPAAAGSVLETYTLMAMVVIVFAWWIAIRLIGVLMNRSVDM
jgi:YggT family protein